MNNKYNILTAMYRYGLLFMEDQPSIQQIENTLTTTNPHTMIPGSKLIVKKALSDNFGVSNKQEMEQVVSGLLYSVLEDGIFYHALLDLFYANPKEFSSVTKELAEDYFSDDKMKVISAPYTPLWEKYHIIEGYNSNIDDEMKELIIGFFQDENSSNVKSIAALFEQNQSWLSKTKGLSMTGFHLSRIISIISDSNVSGYITDEETASLLNFYGSITESLFPNWEAFLFSAIFGKQLMSAASGTFIIDSADYIQSCYKFAAHPAKLYEVAGLWQGSDMTEFCSKISSTYKVNLDSKETAVGESEPRYAFLHSTVLPVFQKYGVAYLFDMKFCELEYAVPMADTNSLSYGELDHFCNKTKLELEDDEIPFLATAKTLITNKRIRILEKKLFKKELHTFSWKEKLTFTQSFSKLDLIILQVNGKAMFHMPRNYEKAGISKSDDVYLEKDKIIQFYSEDIKNALLALAELNQVLASQ
ncbi:DUF1266 domain-containing protein [Clostridium merdae]|uniref:DUF1266 domain-containing protein n=1 Tax=Clostridium merdae TaxID=1958780 RepID=UPI000A270593|nr:DUF1266 domain-containing protein [Clostridium merdae]